MTTMRERLAGVPGLMWHWTCCAPSQEPTFRALLERLNPTHVLEIGTHQGVSAGLLAEYAESVVTVDVLPNPVREKVWGALGVRGRIVEHVHKSQAERDDAICAGAAAADLAFVDGSHLRRDVEYDFGLVVGAGCRRVILHDYWANAEDWPDVREFVDGLSEDKYAVEIHKPFAYVEVRP
jgi:hypothetical protein